MKIINAFNEIVGNPLNEGKHEYGCVMLFFPVPAEFWNKVQDRVDDKDVFSEKDEDGEEKNGRQSASEAHVALLYGYTDTLPDEDVEEIINTFKPIDITLRKISTFNNDEFDVLKFDVEGDELFDYNKLLSELPNETKFPDYHPHLTICYMKKGTVTSEMTKDLSETDLLVTTASKIVYSKPDGTKKEYPLKG